MDRLGKGLVQMFKVQINSKDCPYYLCPSLQFRIMTRQTSRLSLQTGLLSTQAGKAGQNRHEERGMTVQNYIRGIDMR